MHTSRKTVVTALLLFTGFMLAADGTDTLHNQFTRATGISVLSPGLPAALKWVRTYGAWGYQLEANYYYAIGMFRSDVRKQVYEGFLGSLYGFTGITFSHINDASKKPDNLNNTLMADIGMGAHLPLGRKGRVSLGAEGGLLIPFWSSQGLEQFADSGLMVANIYALFWF